MTCIVGIVEEGIVYLGADSFFGTEYRSNRCEYSKVFPVGEAIMGVCGSARTMDLLRFSLGMPKIDTDMDLRKWMVVEFIPVIRECLKDGGITKIKENVEEHDSPFLVGLRGRLFRVDEDFQVGEYTTPFSCIGAGMDFSTGSLFSTEEIADITPRDRITMALKAAVEFSPLVQPPFSYIKTKKLK